MMAEISESAMLHLRSSFSSLGSLKSSRYEPPQRRWLGTSIIFLSTAIATGIAITSYVMVRRMLLENIKQNVLLEVKKEADDIDRWLAMRMAEVQTLANTPTVRTLDWNIIHPHFDQEVERIQDFVSISLGLTDGTYYNSFIGNRVYHPNNTVSNISDRTYFQKAIAGEANISDPFMSRSMNMPNIAIAAPIWQDGYRAQAPIAEIHAQVKVDRIAEVVQTLRYGDGSYAFVLNPKGEAIIHPDRNLMTLIEKPAPSLRNHHDPGLANLARLMIEGEYGITPTMISNAPTYVAYVPLRTNKWSIALVIPQKNIESQLAALNLFAVILAALPIVAATFACKQVKLVKQAEVRLRLLQHQKHNLKQYQKLLRQQAEASQATLADLQKTQSHLLHNQAMSSVGQLLVGITQAVQQPNEAIAKRSREAEQELCILTQLLKNFSAAQNPHSSWTRRHLQTAGQAMQLLGSALHNIQGDVEHIRSLAHVLKGLSQDRHELAAVNVNFLLDDTLRLLEHRLAGQQQHLSIQVLRQYGDIPMIECNITQLNQVFVHLFNNAIEAIEMRFYQGAQIEHPSIRIRTQLLHSGHVLIRITDNGCGIPEGNQSKIFTPFFTTKSQNQGIGLGLFACQNIIQQHQGRIRCISIPNRGTDFLLELPLKQIRQKQQLDQKPLLNLAQNSHQSLPVVISHNRSNQLDPIGATQALQHNNYPIKPTKHNPMDWI